MAITLRRLPLVALATAGLLAGLLGVEPVRAAKPDRVAPYAGRPVCCTDPAEFEYTALPDRGSIEFDINAKSKLFEFQTGVSGFRAFRLPVLTTPYLIEIKSFIRGGPDPTRARLFYPAAALMTDDYLVLRSVGVDALVPELPFFERTTQPAYRLSIGVDPRSSRERYLVVFTPESLLGPRPIPALDGADAAAEVAREAYLGASAEGHLSITITSEGVAPAGRREAP